GVTWRTRFAGPSGSAGSPCGCGSGSGSSGAAAPGAGRIVGSGRGAAWLARLTGGQEVGSSNLPGPTRGGAGTGMRATLLLADAAQVSPDQKLHALGIGWTFTGPQFAGPMALVAIIEVGWNEANRR